MSIFSAFGCHAISGPTTIRQSGCYYVTRDIAGTGNEVIRIQANHVTLDLNSHTLSIPTAVANKYVVLIDPGFSGIVIRNGTLSGGTSGVFQDSTAGANRSRLRLERLTIEAYGYQGIRLTGMEQVDLLDSRILSTGFNGAVISTFAGQFLRNTFRCADSNALFLSGLHGGLIQGNQLSLECDAVGIGVSGSANIIEGNTIHVHGVGIAISDGSGNLVLNNVVSDSFVGGIRVRSDDCRVAGNIVRNCAGGGIAVEGSRNLIEDNVFSGQTNGYGINFISGANNAYRNNMLRGNPSGAVHDPFGNTDAGGNIV